MEDIVATTTDGVSVMKSFGTLICCVHQLCFAHGYHLAVMDFFYAAWQENVYEMEEEREYDEWSGHSKDEIKEVDEDALVIVEAESNALVRSSTVCF